MEEARSASVTGTVVHLDSHVVVIPTEPPLPTRLPRSEQLRRMFLAQNPGWTPPDADSADVERRGNVMARLRAGSPSVVELYGTDLPDDSVRARLRGVLTGRSVRVDSWRPEPDSTSPWAEPRVEGTDPETADAIVDTVREHWPLISIGISPTATGSSAVMLEVERATPEIQAWFDSQPPGSVQLDTFVDLEP